VPCENIFGDLEKTQHVGFSEPKGKKTRQDTPKNYSAAGRKQFAENIRNSLRKKKSISGELSEEKENAN